MPHPVVHWEIAGKDGEKLQQFYRSLFDWEITHSPELNYGMVAPGGEGGIGGGVFGCPEGMPGYLTIYVLVDDLQAHLDKAEGLGGKTVVPPTPIPSIGSFAMFSDPEGHVVGLFKS